MTRTLVFAIAFWGLGVLAVDSAAACPKGWTWDACYKRQIDQGKSSNEAKTWCNEGARRCGVKPR
jgi:hypothetical protein